MTREQFKLMAAGQYAMSNIEGTIDKDKLLIYVEGAIFGWDLALKEQQPALVTAVKQDGNWLKFQATTPATNELLATIKESTKQ